GVPVIKLIDYLSKENFRKEALVITSASFFDIVKQLDEVRKLDGCRCFLMPGLKETYKDRYLSLSQDRQSALNFYEENNTDGKHYQVWECISYAEHAGSKAPSDIKKILSDLGYASFNVHTNNVDESTDSSCWQYVQSKEEWDKVYEMIPSDATLVLQHPFSTENILRDETFQRLKKKGVSIISIVHDVEEVRQISMTPYLKTEHELMLDIADVLVVHNDVMKEYFVGEGYPQDRIISLEVFDYLLDTQKVGNVSFEKHIAFAGSLEERKSPFLKELPKLSPVCVRLYGPDYDPKMFDSESIQNNIQYQGSFPTERIPFELNEGFGLVWDGESIETCSGPTGEYLKLISSHKLSLYIVSGLPVIIWSKAAMASFVKAKDIGIIVDSLLEIPDVMATMKEERYLEMANNAKKLAARLTEGFYLKNAIQKAVRLVNN
ncbi:MAG: hypothetical protein K6A72_10420, partial [Lachnospiraceae bacterium]|nr:hypothetical protein [Lachnospiraceae bacterium]